MKENHKNLQVVIKLLQLQKLPFVVAADLKLLNVLLGLSGHGGKFACYLCEGEMGLEAKTLQTFSSLIKTARPMQLLDASQLP